jgi:hypothetical protein
LSFQLSYEPTTVTKKNDNLYKNNGFLYKNSSQYHDYNQSNYSNDNTIDFNFSDISIFDTNKVIQRKPSCTCEGGCPRCKNAENIPSIPNTQTKIKISQPHDPLEREADRVADQIMNMPNNSLKFSNKEISQDNQNLIQISPKKSVDAGLYNFNKVTEEIKNVNLNNGKPLDSTTKEFMESRFGYDFGNVRMHTNENAAKSAESVNALAYTVANNIVFTKGHFEPNTNEGRKLIAHELVHVIQQGRGDTLPSRFVTNASHENAAVKTTSTAGRRGGMIVNGMSEIIIARTPRSIEVSLDPASLSFTELEKEIKEIQQHLDENPVSNQENDHLMEVQGELQKELANRLKQERGQKKQRRKIKTSDVPRSLTQSLPIDENMPNDELYAEIDAIHDMLRTNIRKSDRVNLTASLKDLETEKQRRMDVDAEHARREKIKHAITPKVTSTDDEALSEVMDIIDNIRQSESVSGMYAIIHNGKVIYITQEEYEKIRGTAKKNLQDGLRRVLNKADDAVNQYNAQAKVNREHPIVSGVVHFFGGIDNPSAVISQSVRRANLYARAAEAQIQLMHFKRGAEFFAGSEKFAKIAKSASQAYVDEVISTGETTISVLEITRDAAFATTLALGAVVAAPVLAAGAGGLTGGLGLTGAGATIVTTAGTAAGTGIVVGTGGALLGGGSEAIGVAVAGGSREEVWKAAKREGIRRGKEGLATGVGGAFGHLAGVGLKVGQSTSTAVNIARGSGAQAVGSATGSATSTALEGGSGTDVLKSGIKGFGIGGATGPLSQGVGAIKNPVLGTIARTGFGAVTSGGITYLETGDKEAAKRSAAIGGASSGAAGVAKPGNVSTPAQKKAFKVGQDVGFKFKDISQKIQKILPPTSQPVPTPSIPKPIEEPLPPIPKPVPPTNTSDVPKGPEIFEELRNELGFTPTSNSTLTSARPQLGRVVKQAQEAGFMRGINPGSVDLAVQEHSSAPTVRRALGVTGKDVESAHVAPTSMMEIVSGYKRGKALTVLLPEQTHKFFDNQWKSWARNQQGKTITAGEAYNVIENAIETTPGLTFRTKATLTWKLFDELFIHHGLKWSDEVRLPWSSE